LGSHKGKGKAPFFAEKKKKRGSKAGKGGKKGGLETYKNELDASDKKLLERRDTKLKEKSFLKITTCPKKKK